MPVYADSESYYANMRMLFECVRTNYPKATEDIARARINILLRTTGPAAEITLHGRKRPVVTTYGAERTRPDLLIDMSADTFHQILLGELSLRTALGNGQMKVKGPVWKVLSLGELFNVSRKCYPDIIGSQR